MSATSVQPQYGVNYNMGWSGFTYYDNSFISKGIAWFTRDSLFRLDKVPVSHALCVTGANECIEAQPKGVVRSNLSKYFEDPHCHIFFRCPLGYDADMAATILTEMRNHLGDEYGYGLIVADALDNSVLGRMVNRVLAGLPSRVVTKCLDRPMEEICSEVVAMGLKAVPTLNGQGCLSLPARMITPSMLAWDNAVYTALKA